MPPRSLPHNKDWPRILSSDPQDQLQIFVIAHNCTDNTEEEYRRFEADYPDVKLRYCLEPQQGLSHARNCGIRQSSGDLLAYVDDDATVNKEYLRTYDDFCILHFA